MVAIGCTEEIRPPFPGTVQTFNQTFNDSNQLNNNSSPLKYFHYQLQKASFSELLNLKVDYIIVDIGDARLSKEQLSQLHQQGKIVLSYLSIGEAEDYRNYWQDDWQVGNPSFLDEENPLWKGNYKVKYWDQQWQEIIFNKVSEIINAEYDGVYLDIVDAYEYYADKGIEDADQRMIDFVGKIGSAAKSYNPKALIIPQNAVELYENPRYSQFIDGFGKEDIWFDDDKKQDAMERDSGLQILDRAVKDNKIVLAIDYPTTLNARCEFYDLCFEHDFHCTISNRELDLPQPILCGIR